MTLINAPSTAEGELVGTTLSAVASRRHRAGSGGPRWLTRTAKGLKWSMRADWAEVLDLDHGPNWLDLGQDPRASRIKVNDGREVWRVELPRTLVFAKVYLPVGRWGRWRRWLMGSDAARESRVAEYAAVHGIETVQPVAAAEAPPASRQAVSILVTAGMMRTRTLNEVWSLLEVADPRTRTIKNTLIDRVARLIAHAHQNGFEHTDLHAGNVLIDPQGDADYRALFVDLHNIRIGRPVSDRAVTRNLAQFNQWFRLHAPLTDRLRFLDRYLSWRDAVEAESAFGRRLSGDRRVFRLAIEEAAQAHANALYAKRDRRTHRTGRYFAKLRPAEGWRGYAYLRCKQPVAGSPASGLAFTSAYWTQQLEDPRRWTTPGEGRYAIKDSAGGTVCRAKLPLESGSCLDVVAKRSVPRNLAKRLKNMFRRSRAVRTWRLANALLNRQIPTARPLAVAERRRGGLLLDSVIITEYIEHAHDLDTILTVQIRELSPTGQFQLKRQVGVSLAQLLRRFHARGFVHRDMKAPNLMVQWNPRSEEPPRILLVDLDGIRQVRRPGRRDLLRAMMRLNVSVDHCRRITRTDRLRFLKQCLIRPGNPAPDWKPIWREIAEMSDRKRRQKSRRQARMLAR